ncbi:chromatin DNA-binding EKC/KEOPS complex subunit PCC1 [Rhodotorula paludigena]|uniref:chromatin DNA-binding EKC/KEOPS complex subunit PCC1 n=1 Tax=Rhodotorula paludigena TaxID=86838 RepID=UPI003180F1EA
MAGLPDRSKWYSVSLSIPFPAPENATLVKRVVEVDKPLRPSELSRELTLDGSTLVANFRAATVAQARVALDHFLSDVELVVQTMHTFGPEDIVGAGRTKTEPTAPSLEVGLMGSWEGAR